jgi:hypothetical protein
LLHGDPLVAEVDGWNCAAGNADDLLVSLRAERKLELSNRKKTKRKATFTSATSTSQPKL